MNHEQNPAKGTIRSRRRIAAAAIGLALLVPLATPLRAVAQQQFVVGAKFSSESVFGDEKILLGNLFVIAQADPNATILAILVQTTGGVLVGGKPGISVSSVQAALETVVTATGDGTIVITIQSKSRGPQGTEVPGTTQGGISLKFVPPPTKATTPPTAPTVATSPPTVATTPAAPPTVATTPAAPPTVATTPAAPPTVATTPQTVALTSPTVAPPPPTAAPSPAPAAGNKAPVAQSTQLVATAGATTPLMLQASDPESSALTYVLVQLPSHGKLTGQAPNLRYTPDGGFLGTDALVFTASDGKDSSAQATVTVTVTGKTGTPAKSKTVTKVKAKKTKVRRR